MASGLSGWGWGRRWGQGCPKAVLPGPGALRAERTPGVLLQVTVVTIAGDKPPRRPWWFWASVSLPSPSLFPPAPRAVRSFEISLSSYTADVTPPKNSLEFISEKTQASSQRPSLTGDGLAHALIWFMVGKKNKFRVHLKNQKQKKKK